MSIQWVHDPYSNDLPTSVLTTANRFTITTMNRSNSVISTLTIRPLDDADTGSVYCQVVFQNGTVANSSQEMDLFTLGTAGACPSVLEDRLDRRCALATGRTASPPPELCRYQYYTQPQLNCNPYNGQDYAGIDTQCDIGFGPTQERVGVLWFFIPENSDTVTRIDEIVGKYSIVTTNFTYTIYSSLSVIGLRDSDRGTYYCQINFENGLLGEPSQNLTLQRRSAYEGQDLCLSGEQKVSKQRCALTTGMMPSTAGPTAVVKDASDLVVIILGSVFGVVGVMVVGVVFLVSGFFFYKTRKRDIGYGYDIHNDVLSFSGEVAEKVDTQ